MNCENDSLLKKNLSLTELKIDKQASFYAEQYRLNGPYMLIYTNYNLKNNEVFYSLIAPGFCKLNTFPMDSENVKNRSMHKHDFFEFMFVIHGCIVQKIEGEFYTYREGQCCLVNQHVRHTEIARDNAEVMFLAISNDFFLNLIRSDIHYDETGHVILRENPIYDLVLKTLQTGKPYKSNTGILHRLGTLPVPFQNLNNYSVLYYAKPLDAVPACCPLF